MGNETQPNQQPTQPSPTIDPIAPSKPSVQSSGENTSGQGSSAVVPEEVKGWSWGGFSLTWIWGIFNGVWLSLLALIVPWPVMNVVLGVKGRELAWQSKRWDSVEQFKAAQHKWSIAGIILGVLGLVIPIILILILIVVVAINPAERLREAEQQQQLQQQNQPSLQFNQE